jgi:hypothetical protein
MDDTEHSHPDEPAGSGTDPHPEGPARHDLLLDLLADEVAERLQARAERQRESAAPELPPAVRIAEVSPEPEATPEPASEPQPALEAQASTQDESKPAGAAVTSYAAALMARLAIGILIIVVLINIPITAQGTALARSIPSSASLVIANGLIVKETTSPDIYIYGDGAFHWITSLQVFQELGYRWQDVHIVQDGFLKQFPKGRPRYVLLKCDDTPHIYQLDAGRKRWIVDIPTFQAQGFVWQDVKIVPCDKLHVLPDGDSIPPGRGTPPPPQP